MSAQIHPASWVGRCTKPMSHDLTLAQIIFHSVGLYTLFLNCSDIFIKRNLIWLEILFYTLVPIKYVNNIINKFKHPVIHPNNLKGSTQKLKKLQYVPVFCERHKKHLILYILKYELKKLSPRNIFLVMLGYIRRYMH